MSRNVAVFVDVANIFYAAKAAAVDIDYVTLLKSATAGRDLVRAYAYTGLDPENENQRQFHGFLARSGYKVVSKDVRKYGDGKVKANLDIELVVDMMRTARNLDVAVVVSGDGDFAPAIRAVQQQGVRCEVISFRGNTSSDLIEVADSFTDITHIAKVERGTRSGRRVAAADDLSMTEVPEKETEGSGRTRRRTGTRQGRRAEPAAAASAAASPAAPGTPGQLIVLPGERLSRAVGGDGELSETLGVNGSGEAAAAAGAAGLDIADSEAAGEGGRRRRRRRGGRGRGRGRGAQGDVVGAEPGVEPEIEPEEEVELDEVAPPRPAASTFGSVWDSQLGVGGAGVPIVDDLAAEADEEEPEIPEYLLAERRQSQRRPRGPRVGGRGGAYQSAVDRERYGRTGGSAFGGRREPSRPSRGPRPRPMPAERFAPPPPSVGGDRDPWSEVPPELEDLLRAQLATRGGPVGAVPSEAPSESPTPAELAEASVPAVAETAEAPSTARRRGATGTGTETRRRRSTRSEPTPADIAGETATADVAAPAEEPPKRRTTRRTTSRSAASAASGTDADEAAQASDAGTGTAAEAPKRTTRRRTTKRPTADEATATADASEAEALRTTSGEDGV